MTLLLVLLGALGLSLIIQSRESKNRSRIVGINFRLKRSKRSQVDWPELVDDLHSAIRAGLSLPQAFSDLQRTAPESLRAAFEQALARYYSTSDFRAGLITFADCVNETAADNFVAALILASELGGTDLGKVLSALSESLRADQAVKQEIKARQSWTINGAKLAVAAPWLTTALLCTRAEARAVYFSSSGLRLLEFCLFISVLAYWLMWRIGQLPRPARLLARQ